MTSETEIIIQSKEEEDENEIVRITKTKAADEIWLRRRSSSSSSSSKRMSKRLAGGWKAKLASVAIYRAMYYMPVA